MSSVEWDLHPIYKIYSVGFLGVVFYSLRRFPHNVCCVIGEGTWGRETEKGK